MILEEMGYSLLLDDHNTLYYSKTQKGVLYRFKIKFNWVYFYYYGVNGLDWYYISNIKSLTKKDVLELEQKKRFLSILSDLHVNVQKKRRHFVEIPTVKELITHVNFKTALNSILVHYHEDKYRDTLQAYFDAAQIIKELGVKTLKIIPGTEVRTKDGDILLIAKPEAKTVDTLNKFLKKYEEDFSKIPLKQFLIFAKNDLPKKKVVIAAAHPFSLNGIGHTNLKKYYKHMHAVEWNAHNGPFVAERTKTTAVFVYNLFKDILKESSPNVGNNLAETFFDNYERKGFSMIVTSGAHSLREVGKSAISTRPGEDIIKQIIQNDILRLFGPEATVLGFLKYRFKKWLSSKIYKEKNE